MALDLDRLTKSLAVELDERRFLHTLGVVQTAVMLAESNGVDKLRVALAALLHDCAKRLSREELSEVARRNGLDVTDLEVSFPQLLHAPVGAVLARKLYGVEDDEVLDAIAHHPLGRSQPSPMLMVLMAADYSEPTRSFEGVEEIRRLVREDLRSGLVEILKRKIAHLHAKGKAVHPRVYETLDSLREQSESQEGVK